MRTTFGYEQSTNSILSSMVQCLLLLSSSLNVLYCACITTSYTFLIKNISSRIDSFFFVCLVDFLFLFRCLYLLKKSYKKVIIKKHTEEEGKKKGKYKTNYSLQHTQHTTPKKKQPKRKENKVYGATNNSFCTCF